MPVERIYNVLFLCTGNSARSILGEALVNSGAYPAFRGFSAGSHPQGEVNPLTLEVLHDNGIATDGLRSKPWDEFAAPGAPEMDFIFTVCDDAAGEACPVWPGKPATAHWGLEDPAKVQGSPLLRKAAFETTLRFLDNRLKAFTSLPLKSIDAMTLGAKLRGIGGDGGGDTQGRGRGLSDLGRRAVAEGLGTALLSATVIGSGIMAQRLTADVAMMLLVNALATGAMLAVLITILGPISGGHFNPVVSAVLAARRGLSWSEAAVYAVAQIAGAIGGAWLAHLMFSTPVLELAGTVRTGPAQWLSEAVATFALVSTILAGQRFRPAALPTLVPLAIVAGYWFTASTSFANPAVTIARALSDSFTGIRPVDVAGFIAAQVVGAGLAAMLSGWLLAAPGDA